MSDGDRPGQEPPRPSARDLVRRRSRTYRAPETGRHHHIGAAPEQQPVLGEHGTSYVGTSEVQLAARTPTQLRAQGERLRGDMRRAAQQLRFEDAAALRDDLDRVEAELARRSGTGAGPRDDSDLPPPHEPRPHELRPDEPRPDELPPDGPQPELRDGTDGTPAGTGPAGR